MGMKLQTYVGPMIQILKTKDFNINDFCYETCKEFLFVPNVEKSDYWFLLPNRIELYANSHSISESDGDEIVPVINPDIQSICEKFSTKTEVFRKQITVPYEVVWGVVSYWI